MTSPHEEPDPARWVRVLLLICGVLILLAAGMVVVMLFGFRASWRTADRKDTLSD